MKQKFVEFVEKLMEANPEITKEFYTEDVKSYFEAFRSNETSAKSEGITKAGRPILEFFQQQEKTDGERKGYRVAEIGELMGRASKGISGSMRKLVADGYIAKVDDTKPVVYILTEKGSNFIFED